MDISHAMSGTSLDWRENIEQHYSVYIMTQGINIAHCAHYGKKKKLVLNLDGYIQ